MLRNVFNCNSQRYCSCNISQNKVLFEMQLCLAKFCTIKIVFILKSCDIYRVSVNNRMLKDIYWTYATPHIMGVYITRELYNCNDTCYYNGIFHKPLLYSVMHLFVYIV